MYTKITLPTFIDERGQLTSMELVENIPFEIERIFFIKCKEGFDRGNHAHKNCYELLVPISGLFTLELDDTQNKVSIECNSTQEAIIINPLVWLNITNTSKDCIILAVCSHPYTQEENIKTLQELAVAQQKPTTFCDLGNKNIQDQIHQKLINIVRNDDYVLGQPLKDFEANFAKYNNVKYCVGVNNGSAALLCAIKALKLSPDPKNTILIQSNAFIAAPLAISECGYKMRIVDIDENLCIDLNDLESKMDETVKAVIVVHLYGNCCNMDKLMNVINKHSVALIEDSAQAHGATFKGKKLGTFGHLGCFSFYPSKNLGGIGEGGCVITDDSELCEFVRKYRNYGGLNKYEHDIKGLNYRLENIQAAVLDVKLPYLDEWNLKRNIIAQIYTENLKNISQISIPAPNPQGFHVYHLYVVLAEDRDELQKYLLNHHIPVSIHYPLPFYKTQAYQELNNFETRADLYSTQLLSLPMHPNLTIDECNKNCLIIREFYENKTTK